MSNAMGVNNCTEFEIPLATSLPLFVPSSRANHLMLAERVFGTLASHPPLTLHSLRFRSRIIITCCCITFTAPDIRNLSRTMVTLRPRKVQKHGQTELVVVDTSTVDPHSSALRRRGPKQKGALKVMLTMPLDVLYEVRPVIQLEVVLNTLILGRSLGQWGPENCSHWRGPVKISELSL